MVTDPPAGISFMGKEWDEDKGGRAQWVKWMTEVMAECLRVLKPGAHALVWAIPRTSHWTGSAIEDAGFEVRDIVTHLFGSGFPKSLDISKAIDKAAGVERKLGPTIGELNGRITANHKKEHDVLAQVNGWDKHTSVPTSDAAKQWDGFGTALKPAAEFWFLARKPISEKTIAANVLKHGTGGLNIDGSRIAGHIPVVPQPKLQGGDALSVNNPSIGRNGEMSRSEGRFPANLVLSHSDNCTEDQCELECAVKMLDEQSGIRPSRGKYKNAERNYTGQGSGMFGIGGLETGDINRFANEQGGASRFFYCAKASAKDKGEGNTHPTIKSTKLMSYLIKLITPPNGIVLDPFMGSGSTGAACKDLNFKFIGIEMNIDYYLIANKRLGLNAQISAQPEKEKEKMKLELAVLAGAESKEFLVNLTKQIENLEKSLTRLFEIESRLGEKIGRIPLGTVTSSLPVDADDFNIDDFRVPAPKAATKTKAASFDDEVESDDAASSPEETDEIDIKELAKPARKPREKKVAVVTIEDVNAACKAKVESIITQNQCPGKEARTKVLMILKRKFGTETLSTLKPEQYADVVKAMAV